MPDAFEDQDWVKLGVARELMRVSADNSQDILEATIQLFQRVLPASMTVQRKNIFNSTPVAVTVDMGERRYKLERTTAGRFRSTVQVVSRGIKLKEEEANISEWIQAVSDSIQALAAYDAAAAHSIRSWLGQP